MKCRIALGILVLFFVGYFAGSRLLFRLNWELEAEAKSPNGRFTVRHFRSLNEGGHAPYGDNVVISTGRSFPWPRSEETFFGGYCESPMKIRWEGNEKIVLKCDSAEWPPRTLASTVHGIEVSVIRDEESF